MRKRDLPFHESELRWETPHYPIAKRFDDGYFSRDGGRAESREVFLKGNDLPARLSQHAQSGTGDFTIAELGFGTGLNFFETVLLWQQVLSRFPAAKAKLRFVSFEQYPLARADLERVLRPWPDLLTLCRTILQPWPPISGWQTYETDHVRLELAVGDANSLLPEWTGAANAWYLDGFAPAKNPQLWNARLMQLVASKTRTEGTFSTYTAAAQVRRDLMAAGFEVTREAGFGRKRHRLQGCLKAIA